MFVDAKTQVFASVEVGRTWENETNQVKPTILYHLITKYSLRFKTKVTFGHNLHYETKGKFLSNFVKQIGMLPETM